MKTWKVTITEALERIVTVEAASAAEAEEKVQNAYSNCDIVLDASDFTGVQFTVDRGAE